MQGTLPGGGNASRLDERAATWVQTGKLTKPHLLLYVSYTYLTKKEERKYSRKGRRERGKDEERGN